MLKKAASGVLATPRVCEAYLVKRRSLAKQRRAALTGERRVLDFDELRRASRREGPMKSAAC